MDNDSFKLLLVEDDSELASMVVDFLSEHGFTDKIERDGKRAADRIRDEDFTARSGSRRLSVRRSPANAVPGCSRCLPGRPDILQLLGRRRVVDVTIGVARYKREVVR